MESAPHSAANDQSAPNDSSNNQSAPKDSSNNQSAPKDSSNNQSAPSSSTNNELEKSFSHTNNAETFLEYTTEKRITAAGTTVKHEYETNKNVVTVMATNNTTTAGNQLPVPVSQQGNNKSQNQTPIIVEEPNNTESNRQVTTVAPTTLSVVTKQHRGQISGLNFVPVPDQPVVSLIFPSDPHSFEHFQNYINSKTCYSPAPLGQSKVLKTQDRVAYRVDLFTLFERRTLELKYQPYRGEETPKQKIIDVFAWKDDTELHYPSCNNEKVVKKQVRAEQTQKTVPCTSCRAQGTKRCVTCYGQGHVVPKNNYTSTTCQVCRGEGKVNCIQCEATGLMLEFAVINFEWKWINSVNCYQNSFLPDKLIRLRQNKTVVFDKEQEWNGSMIIGHFKDLVQTIDLDAPPELAKSMVDNIQKQYQSHYIKLEKSQRITRVKFWIRKVDIIEVDYRLDGYKNKVGRNKGTDVFTYLLYGMDKDCKAMIYENDYPARSCGCLGPKCACSSSCTIS